MSGSYVDVDRTVDPAALVEDQEKVDGWPQVQAYKRRTYELVAGADRVLDVGSGPGGDVVAIGRDRCVGVDASAVMGAAAVARGAAVVTADALRLPFPDGGFGAVRADRVVQHLADPGAAVAEMVRVTRSGGRVVVADPDQETLVIHVPGVPWSLADRVKALRRDVGYRNGRFVTTLPGRLVAMGLGDVTVDAFPLVITDPDEAFGLPTWPRWGRDHGHGFTDADLDTWDRGIERARTGGLVYALLYFVVSGVAPAVDSE
jgi:SAM-dependent methyltransferase